MDHWTNFEFYRITELPLAPPPAHGYGSPPSLSTAISGCHTVLGATDPHASLAGAWVRPAVDGPLQLLLGGRPVLPVVMDGDGPVVMDGDDPNTRPLVFPAGAKGTPHTPKRVAATLEPFPSWVPCAMRSDALWLPDERGTSAANRRGMFHRVAGHLGSPFAWLVLATPLAPEDLQDELDQLVNDILPLTRNEVGEARRVELERKRARHRELSRAQYGGAWTLRVLVGGPRPRDALSAAAMLSAASELEGMPYVVAPSGPATGFTEALRTTYVDASGNRVPFTAATDLVAALLQPPATELPGVRLVEARDFDVTVEDAGAGGLRLGDVLDNAGRKVSPLVIDLDSLNRHAFVCGATGSGKTVTVKQLLERASEAGLPWLVIEPAKAEYAAMASVLAEQGKDVVVIRPGASDRLPAGLNPFMPAKGFPLQTHVDLLKALFLAAFEPHEPFPQILSTALVRTYQQLGWDLALGEPVHLEQAPRYPTLTDLQHVAAQVVADIGYGPEVAADVQGFIKVRLNSLRMGTTGRFLEGGHPLDFDALRDRNVVLEIEDVGDDSDKAFLMGAVLLRLTEELRQKPRNVLSHLTVVEEAHRLLRRPEAGVSGASAHAVEMFAAMLAEIRAYGEGLVIAEQIPSKLTPDIIKNTAVKIVHRLPAHDDRETVGATMNVDPAQSRHIVALPKGHGVAFTDGMDRPVLLKVPRPRKLTRPDARPVSAAVIVARRSPTCGAACQAEPCTLRHMRRAQGLLERWGWLRVWVELTVLAHLAGRHAPMVEPPRLELLRSEVDGREIDCLLSHAVDEAVDARSGVLQHDVKGTDLAAHCVAALRAACAGYGPTSGDAEFGFVAHHYRWLEPLARLDNEPEGDTPHPDTDLWARRYGAPVPGATRREQLAVLLQRWDEALADWPGRDRVTFGARRPSALETAIGSDPWRTDWSARVQAMLGEFVELEWPLQHLIRPQ